MYSWWPFWRCSEDFRTLSEDSLKLVRRPYEHFPNIIWTFPKITEDFWKQPKIFVEGPIDSVSIMQQPI